MKYGILIKNFGFLILLALIPFLLIFKFKWNGILPLIIYVQLLLLWIQAEIGLRQHTLFSAQFAPFFDVRVAHLENIIFLRNVSKNVAYDIVVARILDENRNPITPHKWENMVRSNFISSLAPDEEKLLCSIDNELIRNKSTIHICYNNIFGEIGGFYIMFLEDRKVGIIPEGKFPPGILLNFLEHFSLQFKYLRFKRYIKGVKNS